MHLNKEQVEADFRRVHTHLPADRVLTEPTQLLTEARAVLRERFLAADVGITGANFLIAETGTSIIVTNEGNGDLTQTLPKVHIVLASIEKLVPTLEDVSQLLRVLARSATGQDMSVYTTFSTGPRRPDDVDGPEEYHVILLDNGRSAMLGGEFEDMLRCIRCGACMNHCPIYHAVGGHAYGWVYPGPMGAVLTPSLIGVDKAGHLPNASTFCGRCEAVCPVRIPLPKMMRHWREREFARHLTPAAFRSGLRLWAFFAKRPSLYRLATRVGMAALGFGRAQERPLQVPAARRWLDQFSRHAGAARADVSSPLGEGAEAHTMSAPKLKPHDPVNSLYERDFFLWTQEQAEALRRAAREGSNLPLDWENLAEEIESLGLSDKREILSLLETLIEHLLKFAASPADLPRAQWRKEIRAFRRKLNRLLADSPSLRARAPEFLKEAMAAALVDVEEELEERKELDRAAPILREFRERALLPEEIFGEGFPVPGTREIVEDQ